MKQTLEFIEGTASEIIASGAFINGQKVDAIAISVLAKYGIIQNVGPAEKVQGKRGKVGSIYRIPSSILKAQV